MSARPDLQKLTASGKPTKLIVLAAVLIAAAAILIVKFLPEPYQGETQTGKFRLAEATARGLPAILIFSSPACPACVEMDKVLQRVMPDYQGRVVFIKVNVTNRQEAEFARQYQIRFVPSIFLIDKEGTPKAQSGFVEENILRQAIDKFLL